MRIHKSRILQFRDNTKCIPVYVIYVRTWAGEISLMWMHVPKGVHCPKVRVYISA